MVPAETPREDTFGGMSLGAIRAAKRDAKRREERGLDGVDGDAGKVSSTRRRNLRAKQRILVSLESATRSPRHLKANTRTGTLFGAR